MRRPMLIVLNSADGAEVDRRWARPRASVWEDDAMIDTLHATACTRVELELNALGARRVWRFVEADGSLCDWDEGMIDVDLCDRRADYIVSFTDDEGSGQRAICHGHLASTVEVLSEDGYRDVEVTRRGVDALVALLGDGMSRPS